MTQAQKKERERVFVTEVAELLSKSWDLGPKNCEHPDVIVTEGDQKFGLEVCEIFKGVQSAKGAATKKRESNVQDTVNGLRREYEAVANVPLVVRFVGDMSAANLAKIVPELIAYDWPSKPVRHPKVLDWATGLRVHVTKGLRANWYSMNDRVGMVNRDAIPQINDAIAKKALKLSDYQRKAGADIRLLIVADRVHNSGKLALEQPGPVDVLGFHAVYFYSRPESVLIFEKDSTAPKIHYTN